ncbi:hypothetical protein NW133_07365 [Staphylococcus pettenkoferi]|uniref:Uncharacterized protein n=1 Tax=Staphylococcus pettenkoferi TaxID=170573 RepID=A0ABT4BKZ9_9STAP|nr:hypothetical protein [Staphylococcus pettenkoferi]MCY1563823.1 hypothetical protein [Staphylococcus pettenkoferi]MCY1583346.1 hypothetical protein [Staphylococcus pettenkoferi]
MSIKPKVITDFGFNPEFLRDAKNVEYTVGNPVLDGSKFSQDTVVKAGTAIHKNKDTGLYELVGESTSNPVAAVLTANEVKVAKGENEEVSAIRKASVHEERTHGVNDAFKQATQGRIVFDI